MGKYVFVIPTLATGGAERVIAVLSQELCKCGQDVYVVKYYETDGEYNIGDRVKVVNLSGGNRSKYEKMNYLNKTQRLRTTIKAIMPDYVIPFMFSVARCVDIATIGLHVNVLQSIRINPSLGPASRIQRMQRDHLVYKSKASFVQNESQKNYFNKSAQHKIYVLYNPVSDDLFEIKPTFQNDMYTICSVGRLESQKNFKLLIDSFEETFAENERVILQIYGEGSQKESLREHIASKSSAHRIHLMGRNNDIARVYENSDLFVLPSDYEGMPNALIEAMACGLPCISTNCPTGPSDLIDNGINGILVPVGNKRKMSEALQNMYQKRDIAKQMGEKARQTIMKKCRAENIAQQMISICESIK